jgi:hypothetical protein
MMRSFCWPLCLLLLAATPTFAGDDFDEPPISYRTSQPTGHMVKFQQRLADGKVALEGKTALDALRVLLSELQVPESSQMLVFSKTSLQRGKISPRTPRAIYFSDDVYVGYCHNSHLIEVSEIDPQLGAVFYAVETSPDQPLQVERQTDDCLICHGSSQTRQVPGHLVRSVFVDASGLPVLSMGSHRTDQSSPIRQRWGGWYVTGTHGEQTHLGNLIVRGKQEPEKIDNALGQNLTSLEKFFDTQNYLTPHSDIVALMVLEHQVEGHNRITRAGFQCRTALHQQQQLNKELGKPDDYLWDSTKSRIRSASEELVRYLLYCEEASLTAPVKGTSNFAEEFQARGPRDPQGRSLRDFDLTRRMFKFPCSYLVYTEAFDALPQPVKDHVWQRIWEVVTDQETSSAFAHLSADDRRALREILVATKKDLPDYWRAGE